MGEGTLHVVAREREREEERKSKLVTEGGEGGGG